MSNEKMLVDDMMLTKLFQQAKDAGLGVHEAMITDVFEDEMFYEGKNAERRKERMPKANRYVAVCACIDTSGYVYRGSGIAAPDSIPKFEFLKMASEIAIIRAKAAAFTLALESSAGKVGIGGAQDLPSTLDIVEKAKIEPPAKELKKEETKQEETKQEKYTAEQISKMKAIKERLHISEDKGLNQFIWEWSAGQLKTWDKLTPKNIDGFITFMNTNF